MHVISPTGKRKADASVSELVMLVFNKYHHDLDEDNALRHSRSALARSLLYSFSVMPNRSKDIVRLKK